MVSVGPTIASRSANRFQSVDPAGGPAHEVGQTRILSPMEDRLTRQALASFLDRFSPTAQALAERARNRLLDIFPDALETAEGKELGYGFDRGYKGLMFTISL